MEEWRLLLYRVIVGSPLIFTRTRIYDFFAILSIKTSHISSLHFISDDWPSQWHPGELPNIWARLSAAIITRMFQQKILTVPAMFFSANHKVMRYDIIRDYSSLSVCPDTISCCLSVHENMTPRTVITLLLASSSATSLSAVISPAHFYVQLPYGSQGISYLINKPMSGR